MRPGAPGAGGAQQPPEKEEGPGEKAPNQEEAENPALQPLPAWPQEREKPVQFFQLNGYIRFRAYLFHALNLGIYEGAGSPRAPFGIPYSEYGQTGMRGVANDPTNPASSCAARDKANCRTDNMTSADMRMRLEPTINVSEDVRVHAQLDIFDNLVMGSTPDGFYLNNSGAPGGSAIRSSDVPFLAASRGQAAPEAGINSVYSSIRAKRAWAEVRLPFGELHFGRMPSHFGMGIFQNNGDCLDCDYGVNVDRVMFAAKLWSHVFTFMWDWASTGPTTQIVGPQQGQGVFYNADTLDDVSQWALSIVRKDTPEALKEKLDAGKVVFNYGGYFIYRQQDWDETASLSPSGNSLAKLQAGLVPRHAKMFVPDVWIRLNWRKLHLEAEGVMAVGTVGSLRDIYPTVNGSTDILSGGFVVKADYSLLHDALKIYLEIGYASGDDSEDLNAAVNFRQGTLTPINGRISRFNFDPDYHVDQILFRRILGTVSNATYFKPGVSYDIFRSLGARVDIMYALANRPVAYPGNSSNLGLEIDAQVMYKNEREGFYAGLVYGVLFPFAALGLPASIYPTYAKESPDIAQTFQARLVVKF